MVVQSISQFADAVTGQVPAPAVRSGVDRTWYMNAHAPGAGVSVVFTSADGADPTPWHVTGAASWPMCWVSTGAPIDHVTVVIRAVAVTDTTPAVTVTGAGCGLSNHRYNQYRAATCVASGPHRITGADRGISSYACCANTAGSFGGGGGGGAAAPPVATKCGTSTTGWDPSVHFHTMT